ncbi:MAG: hypothetical protein HQK82_12830 [Desulfovibrionaceae bacterium]|nr:hypothetical protein [Desulfovibrionaceae bacterium]
MDSNESQQSSQSNKSIEAQVPKDLARAKRVATDFVLQQWAGMVQDATKQFGSEKVRPKECIPTCVCIDCPDAAWSIEWLNYKYKKDERIPAYATIEPNNWSLLCFCKGKHRHIGGYVYACSLNPADKEAVDLIQPI